MESDLSANVDVIRGIVGQALPVLVVAHRRFEILVTQMGLHLLRFGTALDGHRAAGVAEHVGRDVARETGTFGITAYDQVDRLIGDRFTVGLIAGQRDKDFALSRIAVSLQRLSIFMQEVQDDGL